MKADVSPDTRELTTVNGRSNTTALSYMIPDEHIRRRELDSTHILTPQQLAERLQVKPSWSTNKRGAGLAFAILIR